MLALTVGGGALASPAGAAEHAPITDYAGYPAALPPGCPEGPGALVGVSYSNGRGGEELDLRRLRLLPGDVLTASWDSFAPGCAAGDGSPLIALSLHAYDLSTPTFDMRVDQRLLAGWVACGAGLGACPSAPGGGYELSVAVPGPAQSELCNTQMGLVIGLPLAVVGPSGSYYNRVLRNDTRPSMGIGATNFAIPDCVAGPSPTGPPPTVPPPTVPPPAEPSPVVPPPAVAPTEAAAPPPPAAVAVAAAQVSQPPEVAQTEVLGTQVRQLPATGSPSRALALVGSALVMAGAALVLVGRRAGATGV